MNTEKNPKHEVNQDSIKELVNNEPQLNPNFEEGIVEPKESKPIYKSKEGFVQVPVRRGFTEISYLWIRIKYLEQNYPQYHWFICGGYVRYMASIALNPVPASDIDIYCEQIEGFEVLKAKLSEDLTIRHENNISLTFERVKDPQNNYFGCPTIQMIKPEIEGAIVARGDMQTILENFDFTVIRVGLMNPLMALVDADFEHDEPGKILRLKNIHCPISSTLRCMKYARKGYWLPPLQALKLFIDWDRRTDDYRNRIIEFLEKANQGEGLTQVEIDELEKLMRID